ncbi:MAG: hypothetical protein MZW92_50335 [Comamonadaceae bacterium]|nr:hypothetical protein [Comamonadaceae bacterium]
MLQAAVAADRIVIMQAANTGLTGGSTPDGAGYDREIVLVNTLRIDRRAAHRRRRSRSSACPARRWTSSSASSAPLGPRAALGDRLVVHRRVGARRHLQQLRRRAGAPRPGLHRAGAVRAVSPTTAASSSSTTSASRLGDTPEEILTRLERGDYRRSRRRARQRPRRVGPAPCRARARGRRRHPGALQRRPVAAVRGLGFGRQAVPVRGAAGHLPEGSPAPSSTSARQRPRRPDRRSAATC